MKLKMGSKFLIMSFLIIFISISIVMGMGLIKIERNSEHHALLSLEHRVRVMEYSLQQKGPISIKDGKLVAGDFVVDDDVELVDRVKSIFGGTATIFKGDVRVSTNVKKEDGSRAVGTRLTGAAYDTVFRDKKTYRGEVPILGTAYYTCYMPLADASGSIVGILYAGVKKEEFMNEYYAMVRDVVIASVFLLCFFCSLVFFYTKRITVILHKVTSFSKEFASGNLLCNISIKTGDELEHMADSLSEMRVHLNSVISDISKVSMQLSTSSEELSASSESSASMAQSGAASTEEMTATIEEISAGMDSIDVDASSQLDSIQQLIGRLGVLSEVAGETAAGLKQAGENSADINLQASTGQKLLDLMSQTMQQINTGSQEMLNITTIINDISDKINLLSLNASIEAARAGDAGRGFAVVAEEISKLADQTANSIKSIDTLIRGNNAEITNGLSQADQTVKAIGNIVTGVETINGMLSALHENMGKLDAARLEVENDAKSVIERADAIKSATGEQKLAMNEMVRSVSNLTEVTQSSASGSEEIASSSGEIAAMAEALRGKVDYFKYD
jgi:methyl-accepting chemotaxis protein